MPLTPGTRLGPYEILAPLGAGGMGEVYRATDAKLGRDVALKVLPAEMARDPERLARFRREAKALAQLDHPNIVTIHSVEESDGIHFLTMQLVEGQPLDRLIPAGGLPVEQIVEIASALGDALAAAHEKGIVHRDLKPANVMVTSEGRVKVLDFGLAKDIRGPKVGDATLTSASQTQVGVVMGTPAYMSPEQTSGRPLDHRTDIFSLGVVLHEMATGRRPFEGTSSAELASAILRDTPPSVTDVRPDLPSDLARIIRRCLEKDPRHRVQTARDVSNEFRDLTRQASQKGAVPDPARAFVQESPEAREASGAARSEEGFSVAVLPFKSSGDAEMESFANGLAEDITTGLSRFRYLSVVASASALRLKGEAGDERALGGRLGARYVLEGSIRKGGSAIRLSAQLIDAQTGAQLWAETYNRDLQTSSIFAVQDDVAARIVATVADSYGVLVHSIRSAIRQKDDVDLTPVEWQFQYFAYREQITPSAHEALKSRLERVVERDERRSDLWACLAQIYVDEYAFGFQGDKASLDRALAAARRAVEFDRANQFALVSLAQVHFFRRDLAAFGPAAERAMALNPLNTDALGILGLQIVHAGEFERGTAIVRRAMELNANHAGWMHFAPLWEHFHKREYEQALECANRVDVPGLFWPYLVVAAACGHLGRRAEAEAAVRDLLALDPEFAAHARSNIENWHFASGLLEPVLEGLSKAGLSIPSTDGSSDSSRRNGTVAATADRAESGIDSGASRAEQGFLPTQGISGIKRQAIALAIAVSLLVIASAGVGIYLKRSKTGQIDSIAVLPLENRNNDTDADYISDGITESINNSLARLPGLKVIPHSVAFHYKGKAMDFQKIGDELHVQSVLTGRVGQRGDDLTIDVELDDVRNGKQLWGEQYHRKLADLLAVQSDIAREVSQRLRSQLSAADQKKLTKGSTDNPEAYQLYLKGKYYTNKLTKDGFAKGLDYFNQAIALDPNYGLAYSGLAYNYINQDDWYMPPNQAGPKTKDAAEKALAIDESDANAHVSLAIETQWYEWNWAAAESEFKRAIELSPNSSEAHGYYAWFLASMGRKEEALTEAKRSQQADPLSSLANFFVGSVSLVTRQWDPAIEQLRSAIELDSTFWFDPCYLGRAYEQKGRLTDAIAEFQRAVELEKDNSETWSALGYAYAVSGKKAEAQKVLDHLKELSAHNWVAPYNVAVIYAGLGEKDQAFAWLDRAYKDRSYYLAQYLPTDERLDSLRSDPRFVDLRRRVGLPE